MRFTIRTTTPLGTITDRCKMNARNRTEALRMTEHATGTFVKREVIGPRTIEPPPLMLAEGRCEWQPEQISPTDPTIQETNR